MAIQFPDFQRISFDEANPWLVGAERGQKLMQQFMQFPEDLKAKELANQIAKVNAQYAQPMAEQALTKAQQENKYYGKNIESEMALRNAQAGLYGQQAKYYGQDVNSQIALRNAQAESARNENQMNLIKLRAMQSALSGQQAVNQPAYTPINNATNTNQSATAQGVGGTVGIGNAQTAPSQPQQPQQQPQANTIYGIETPTLTSNDIANKLIFGIDTYSTKADAAKTQQQDQYTQYQKSMAETINGANAALKAKQILSVFNNAMDNTGMKGSYWGESPSTGWRTIYHPDKSVTNAQIADNAVSNLLPGAITELREAMKTGQFSVADLNAASQMKVSRTMNDDTRKTQTAWLNGVWDRFDEKSKFESAMSNPHSGATKMVADQLWEQYQRQFPLISSDGKEYLGSNLGNWPLYTTPQAIASIKATGTYTPSEKELNTYMMQLPDGRTVPIKKGKVESAFKKGARPL